MDKADIIPTVAREFGHARRFPYNKEVRTRLRKHPKIDLVITRWDDQPIGKMHHQLRVVDTEKATGDVILVLFVGNRWLSSSRKRARVRHVDLSYDLYLADTTLGMVLARMILRFAELCKTERVESRRKKR